MTRRKSLIAVLLALPATIIGVACDKDYTPVKTLADERRDENGWPLYRVPEEGIAIALPPDWEQIDAQESLEKNIRANLKRNPEFNNMWATLKQQLPKGVKFFAIEESSMNTTFITNITVLRIRHDVKYTLDQMVDIYLNELDKLESVSKKVSHERTKITAGDAERFQTTLNIRDHRGSGIKLKATEFLFMKGYDWYQVTMTTITERYIKYEPIFDKIGQSFRLIQ